MPHPRTVLCYGDSNTYGHAAAARPDGRYGPDERWTGVLRAALGAGWVVIEEGLGGRTTVSDDPIEGADRHGRTYLYPCLMSHKPLDVVVIMLGTNDLKARFNKTAWEIAAGVGVLVDIVKTAKAGRNEGVPRFWWCARRRPPTAFPPTPRCSSALRRSRTGGRRTTGAWPARGAFTSSMPARSSNRARWTASTSTPKLFLCSARRLRQKSESLRCRRPPPLDRHGSGGVV